MELQMTDVIKESFTQYAGAVLQSRALVDVRDCIKPSARQIFYCLHTDKFTYDKSFKKTLKAIGSVARLYIHGDSSAEGIIMRSGQPFAMRYPLVEVEGSYGNLLEAGNWAAPRYTGSRLSKITDVLFNSIEKNTVDEWRDNYDDTEKYPTVLPSLGYYNIVNGSMGIGVALASSIPQFNIHDVNNALIKLLWNPNIADEELVCTPDFATGGILLNATEVKESLLRGNGKSAKLRAKIEYDEKEKCLVVREMPYGVYTNTVCGQLENLIETEPTCGIARFNDLSGKEPNLKIYLTRGAKIAKVLSTLYSKTSLQYYYSINLTMLDNGRFPKVFTWKEALSAHLEHEKKGYRRALEFDRNKCEARLEVVNGIIRAMDMLEEVISLIRNSNSSSEAATRLINELNFTAPQTKAILAITLSRLAHLEVNKYIAEKQSLEQQLEEINHLLSDEIAFYRLIEDGLRKVAEEFGDERRTEVLDLKSTEEDSPIENTVLTLRVTNLNRVYVEESTTLLSNGRNKDRVKGLRKGEIITEFFNIRITDSLHLYTSNGYRYKLNAKDIKIGEWENLYEITNLPDTDVIVGVHNAQASLILVTSKGIGKKLEGDALKGTDAKIIGLEDDELSYTIEDNPALPYLVLTTYDGYCEVIPTSDIPTYGRTAKGVGLINTSSKVISANLTSLRDATLTTFTSDGKCKQTALSEFRITKRNSKGVIAHKIPSTSHLLKSIVVEKDVKDLTILTNSGIIKLPTKEIPTLGRATGGNKVAYLKDGEEIKEVYV